MNHFTANPIQNEPVWSSIQWEGDVAYSRPLLGSELLADQFSRFQDGTSDCIMGFTFSTTLSFEEVDARLRDGYARLRFECPIIAAPLVEGVHDPDLRSWVYVPAATAEEVIQWARESVVVHPEPMDSDDFMALVNLRRLPYVLYDGTKQFVRCFLVRSPAAQDIYSIFLHGPHSIMDARPTINAFSLLLTHMSVSAPPPLTILEWGTEWRNLPAGPVTATGGPRPNWDGKAAPVLAKMGAILTNPIPTHSIKPQRSDPEMLGRPVRVRVQIGKDESAALVKAIKAAGFTVTHLFDAAQILAILERNPVPAESAADAHITYAIGIIAIARYRVPPHDGKNQLISEMAIVPLQVKYADIPQVAPQDRLFAVMAILKAQYDEYLANPHLPHLFPAQMRLAPPRVPVITSNPHATVITNLGVIEHSLASTWYPDGDATKPPLFEISALPFGHRMTMPSPSTHVWSIRSKLHVQVETTDVWDKTYMTEYLNEIVRQALYILD